MSHARLILVAVMAPTLVACANRGDDEGAVRRTLADTERRINLGDPGFVTVFAKDASQSHGARFCGDARLPDEPSRRVLPREPGRPDCASPPPRIKVKAISGAPGAVRLLLSWHQGVTGDILLHSPIRNRFVRTGTAF
jgi:hypothetical protein